MKKVLLIGGGGTLGTYTSKELISLGYDVDVICLEDMVSENENLKFYKAEATNEYIAELFKRNHYDGIVNFIHYPELIDIPFEIPLVPTAADPDKLFTAEIGLCQSIH